MTYNAVVVGAGMAGLAAARVLSGAGLKPLVLEKNAECGGRLATARLGGGFVDVGAQFFTARSPEFISQTEKQEHNGSLSLRFEKDFMGTMERCLYAPGGMAELARLMMEGLEVKTGIAVMGFQSENNVWKIRLGNGEICFTRSLILTPPYPVLRPWLESVWPKIPNEDQQALENIRYLPCLCLAVELDGPSAIASPGYALMPHADINWVTDNRSKGLSQSTVLTVLASPEFSEQNFNEPESAITAALIERLGSLIPSETRMMHAALYRWPYSRVAQDFGKPFYRIPGLPPLYLAGDGFAGARVEGAFTSGFEAGNALAQELG